MSELLAPAGSFEALIAAISNGADAIYLGMMQFGARAYATNFDYETLNKAIKYAHLRDVKIYITMNTIVYENELSLAYEQIDKLYLLNVDGIIVQDLALLSYILNKYPLMEAHASTQMGFDDLEGIKFAEKLGVHRVVLARETDIDTIKEIKKNSKMPIEVFVHGALCVSYSGNCHMSGLIGHRSGNRGRCVGSCRKQYSLVNKTKNIKYDKNYILSMKDLNTSSFIDDLKIVDSLKIEGRMKEPIYVANVVNSYRTLLDKNSDSSSINKNLLKTFNRTFTKGYIFKEDKKNISNLEKPNNYGYEIGKITNKYKNTYQITLNDTLNQNDQIRIDTFEDFTLNVVKMYDKDHNLINSADKVCYIDLVEKLNIGDKVYKTLDNKYLSQLEKSFPKEFKRFPLNIYISGSINKKLEITVNCLDKYVSFTSSFVLEEAINTPTTYENFNNQFSKLNESVYELNYLEVNIPDKVFIPIGQLNEFRRDAIELINNERLLSNRKTSEIIYKISPISFLQQKPTITAYCSTVEQYNACKELGIEDIYYDNIIRRNEVTYPKKDGTVLVGGYSGINHYTNNYLVSDFSLNVINATSINQLHNLGVKRVTLSYELNQSQINDIISSYYLQNNGYPNLEMIVYGRLDAMFTKYCPLKSMDLCPTCKANTYILEDNYTEFPLVFHNDCTVTILNGKTLNLVDYLDELNNINYYRLQFTIENYEETKNIIKVFQDKLATNKKTNYFNEKTDTLGHYNKETL